MTSFNTLLRFIIDFGLRPTFVCFADLMDCFFLYLGGRQNVYGMRMVCMCYVCDMYMVCIWFGYGMYIVCIWYVWCVYGMYMVCICPLRISPFANPLFASV